MIISHPLIDGIRLENCFEENVNAYEILCSLIASTKQFSFIDLESNNIRTGGRTEIPDLLVTNPPLQKLYLANNQLYDSDAILIARALKQNTNLLRLRLGQNNITDVGRDALQKAAFDPTSFNTVADSNHSCSIEGIDLGGGNVPTNWHVDSPKVNRARKIYSLLSSRHREGVNVHHLDTEFEDDSLKFVPKVLESIHINAEYARGYKGNVHPLSVMYEVLQSWKMPTLYENNGATR